MFCTSFRRLCYMEKRGIDTARRRRPVWQSTDTTRVPAQKVHNNRSDRCIALNFFSLVFVGCFTWRSVESVLHADDIRSCPTTDTTRVPTQKVHKYRSDRWITLKFVSRVSRGCFTWRIVESILHTDDVRSPYHRHDKSTGSKDP